MNKKSTINDVVTIRFAGDSGDGMQLTGNQFSDNTAIFGNDLKLCAQKYALSFCIPWLSLLTKDAFIP